MSMPSMELVLDAVKEASRNRYWSPRVELKDNRVIIFTEETGSTISLSREGTTYRIRQSFEPSVSDLIYERGTFPGSDLEADAVARTMYEILIRA